MDHMTTKDYVTSESETDNKGQYSIQLASKISGVGVHTIRAWEKRYQAVVPQRNPSGRREYSDQDIERLSLLSELCSLGHTIGKIAQLPTQELKSQLEKLGKQSDGSLVTHEVAKYTLRNTSASFNLNESLSLLFASLEGYQIDIISKELNRLKLVLNPRDLALKVISPLLNELEVGVGTSKYNIAQKNALSALVKFHIGHILFHGNNLKSGRPHKVLLCSPEGSFNEFGILLGALLCSFYNLPFYYLGPNLPYNCLLDSYRFLKADLIIVETKNDEEALGQKFMKDYALNVSTGIGQGRLIMDKSKTFEQQEMIELNKVDNIAIVDDIDALDKYLKSL